MRKRSIAAALLAGLCAACGGSTTQAPATTDGASATGTATPAAPAEEKPAAPVVREVVVPDGTALRLDLATPVASDTSRVEDPVRATLREAVKVGGETVLPVGTELTGTVSDVERSGRVKGRARVALKFTSMRHGSERYTITTVAVVHEAQPTKKKDATKVAIGAGIGAAIGAIAGGGSGAAKGAAIGGAGGTGAVLATRGDEARLGAGANITTRLTAPLTVTVQ